MDITYDSYNDIKNKCENYDLYTCDFIYGDNAYSLTNINDMMTMTLKIKNKNITSILNNLPLNLDNLIIYMNEQENVLTRNNINTTCSGGMMMTTIYGASWPYLQGDYTYLDDALTNLPTTLKKINLFYYDNNKNYNDVKVLFKFLFNAKIPLNCKVNLNIDDIEYQFISDEQKFVNSDNFYTQCDKSTIIA